ncbi:MAG: hypothetical protein WC710_01910 [Gallionella sp.]|jgi:hypothetical protein
MKHLREKIEGNKLPSLCVMTPLNKKHVRENFTIDPDYDINKYEGPVTKEYFLRDKIDLSKKYKYVFKVMLDDYGYLSEDELVRSRNSDGEGELSLKLENSNFRNGVVVIEGRLHGNGYDFGGTCDDPVVDLEVICVPKSENLSLFQEILLEAYSLELEKNYRVSFISYFTAIEAYITKMLEDVRCDLYTELHDSLERLPLDEKLRIVAKRTSHTLDLSSIKIWGELCGLFRSLKVKRNEVTHAKKIVDIKKSDIDDIFTVITVLYCFTSLGIFEFNEIKKTLYPKLN